MHLLDVQRLLQNSEIMHIRLASLSFETSRIASSAIYMMRYKEDKKIDVHYGAPVAKWLVHLAFTSKAAGSSLSENFLNATRTQSSCEKSKKSTLCRKLWVSFGYSGFLPQGGLGKKGPQ
jgi:hypothetical protein